MKWMDWPLLTTCVLRYRLIHETLLWATTSHMQVFSGEPGRHSWARNAAEPVKLYCSHISFAMLKYIILHFPLLVSFLLWKKKQEVTSVRSDIALMLQRRQLYHFHINKRTNQASKDIFILSQTDFNAALCQFLTLKKKRFTNQLQRFFPGCGGQLTGRLLAPRANETQGRGPIASWDDCYFVRLKFCRAVPALDGVVPLFTPLFCSSCLFPLTALLWLSAH